MFVIDRSLYLSPEVVGEPGLRPLKEVDPFSLEALVAWLEKQDADERYNFDCINGSCLIGQWMRYSGLAGEGHVEFRRHYNNFCDQWFAVNCFDLDRLAVRPPETFGAAKDRARKLLAEREK